MGFYYVCLPYFGALYAPVWFCHVPYKYHKVEIEEEKGVNTKKQKYPSPQARKMWQYFSNSAQSSSSWNLAFASTAVAPEKADEDTNFLPKPDICDKFTKRFSKLICLWFYYVCLLYFGALHAPVSILSFAPLITDPPPTSFTPFFLHFFTWHVTRDT